MTPSALIVVRAHCLPIIGEQDNSPNNISEQAYIANNSLTAKLEFALNSRQHDISKTSRFNYFNLKGQRAQNV